jgi:hypothetical protein
VLTEGSDWPEKQRRGSTAMAGGGDGAALMERVAAGVFRAPGLHGSTRSGAVKVPRGLRRMETRRRRRITVAELLTSGNV